jgi:hypothetical protein
MLRAFRKVDAKRRGASSVRRERYSPGELRHASLRASPRRAFTGTVLLFGLGLLLCSGGMPAVWDLSRASLPRPDVTAPHGGATRETEPEERFATRDIPATEPQPRTETIAPESSLLPSETSAAAPTSSGEADPTSEPSSTGSISEMPENPDQRQQLPAAPGPEELPRPTARQVPAEPAPPIDQEAMTGGDLVDLNTASAETLDSLGIGLVGRRLVGNRPYVRPEDILTKRVLTRKDFELIRSKVTAR